MKKLTLASMVLLSSMAYADTKFGTVDPIKVYQQVPQGEAMINALQKDLQPKINALQQQQQQIIVQIHELNQKMAQMNSAQQQKAQQAIIAKQDQFKKQAIELRQEEAKQEQTVGQAFQSQFNQAIEQIAKKDGYNMIFSAQAVAYGQGSVDVTDAVIAIMQQQAKQ
jgi:outer membrane protein